jgi:hypothetical protein
MVSMMLSVAMGISVSSLNRVKKNGNGDLDIPEDALEAWFWWGRFVMVRCAFFDRNLHSRNAIGCSFLLPVGTVNFVQTRKVFMVLFLVLTMNSATALMTSHNTKGLHGVVLGVGTRTING